MCALLAVATLFGPHQPNDRQFGLVVGIGHRHLEGEAVHLGFRQRIGALLLDGVLGGQHHKEFRQAVALVTDGDRALGHRFEQRGLHLGGGAVHLVGQYDAVEDGALLEAQLVGPLVLLIHLGAGHIGGEQIGGELNAAEAGIECLGQRLDRAGLGGAGQAFKEYVAIGQQANHQRADHMGLADHAVTNLFDELRDLLLQGVHSGFH